LVQIDILVPNVRSGAICRLGRSERAGQHVNLHHGRVLLSRDAANQGQGQRLNPSLSVEYHRAGQPGQHTSTTASIAWSAAAMDRPRKNKLSKPFLPMSCNWVQYTCRKLWVDETDRVEQGLVNLNKRRQGHDDRHSDIIREGPSARVSLNNVLSE
jgi:hypothetical protein